MLRAEALDLVEHVAGDDHRPALLAETAEQLDGSQPLAGIEPFEGLVEDQEIRVVDDRLGQLDPLPHALRVGGQGTRVAGVELDGLDGPQGGLARVGEAVQGGGQAHELHDGLAFEEPLLLRGDADATGQGRVAPGVLAEDADRPLRGVGQPAQDAKQRRLARAVRARAARSRPARGRS